MHGGESAADCICSLEGNISSVMLKAHSNIITDIFHSPPHLKCMYIHLVILRGPWLCCLHSPLVMGRLVVSLRSVQCFYPWLMSGNNQLLFDCKTPPPPKPDIYHCCFSIIRINQAFNVCTLRGPPLLIWKDQPKINEQIKQDTFTETSKMFVFGIFSLCLIVQSEISYIKRAFQVIIFHFIFLPYDFQFHPAK